jgi:hypothetical protein
MTPADILRLPLADLVTAAAASGPAGLAWLRFRCDRDLAAYMALCWPGIAAAPFAPSHRAILAWFDSLPPFEARAAQAGADAEADPIARSAWEAPRGTGKTSVAIAALDRAVRSGREPYVVIIGPESAHASALSVSLQAMLSPGHPAASPMLAALYGDVGWTGNMGDGAVRRGAVLGFPAGVSYVSVRSIGGTIRGLLRGTHRPTLVLLDDLEKPDDVGSMAARDAMHEKLNSDVLNLGPQGGGLAVCLMATRLHPDAVSARLQRDPAWDGASFRGIVRWPVGVESGEIQEGSRWAEWRALLTDPASPARERERAALDFYRQHRDEMDAGAEVLDPHRLPLYRAMLRLVSIGLPSFLKDVQNAPIASGGGAFRPDSFRWCTLDGRDVVIGYGDTARRIPLPAFSRAVIHLDPTTSRKKGSTARDFAGFAVVAMRDDRATGERLYVVLEWSATREEPEDQAERAWAAWARWRAAGIPTVEVVYESNGGGGACLQGEYHAEMRRRRKAAGLPSTMEPVAIHETRAKDACISGVVPLLNNGVAVLSTAIRSHEGGREALRQTEAWPGGAHDDGPDALSKALLRLESASTGGLSLADAERALSLFSRAAG